MDHLIDDNDRLKPCPFCEGEATFDHDDNGWNWIECLACGASTNARVSAMDDCKPLLLEQWNKRVPSEVQPAPSELVVTPKMEQAFHEKVEVTTVGSIRGLADGIKAAMLAAAPEAKP